MVLYLHYCSIVTVTNAFGTQKHPLIYEFGKILQLMYQRSRAKNTKASTHKRDDKVFQCPQGEEAYKAQINQGWQTSHTAAAGDEGWEKRDRCRNSSEI